MTNKEKQLAIDYKSVFSSEAGERVYEDLMRECYMNHPAHNVDNVNETFILGGKRAMGIYIKDLRELNLSKKIEKIKDDKQPIET